MAGVVVQARNGARLFENMLTKTGMENVHKIKQRITYQTGVTDGGADLTLTSALAGDFIYDVDNDDWFLCIADGATTAALNS